MIYGPITWAELSRLAEVGQLQNYIFPVRLHGKLAAGTILNLPVALESTRLVGTTRKIAITFFTLKNEIRYVGHTFHSICAGVAIKPASNDDVILIEENRWSQTAVFHGPYGRPCFGREVEYLC